MPGFQFYFELIGAVAFAISGAALAVKKHMDLFGVAMMGMTTAVGGGILRDLLLGITPRCATPCRHWWPSLRPCWCFWCGSAFTPRAITGTGRHCC